MDYLNRIKVEFFIKREVCPVGKLLFGNASRNLSKIMTNLISHKVALLVRLNMVNYAV